jgi:uncharacterized DUF497 family protein
MRIDGFVWQSNIVDKLWLKHGVDQEEAEEVFFNNPRFWFVEKGSRENENVYAATGQTDAGRYLIVFFIHKTDKTALILSARDMDKKERKRHAKK